MATLLNGWYYSISENYNQLIQAEMENNAQAFYNYFAGTMTLEAICGILGNISQESQLNPGQEEGGYGGSEDYGYGLIQWTPYPRGAGLRNPLLQWCDYKGYTWYDGNSQCELIGQEGYFTDTSTGAIEPKVWFASSIYPQYSYTWDEFKALTDVAVATRAYFYERERGADTPAQVETLRVAKAQEWYNYLSGIVTPFTPRTSLAYPAPSPWYTPPDNWYAANSFAPGYGITYPNGNCTWYAFGRYAEIRGAFANLSHNNAGNWYDEATAFNRGQTPQLGAVACYHDPSGVNPGHVTIVEQINSDGSILVSQSGYNTYGGNTYFWTETLTQSSGYRSSWYIARNYVLQGFIYNTISPVPPSPTPSSSHKMPLWMMIKRQIY